MSKRSRQTKVKKLQKQFKTLFGSDSDNIHTKIHDKLKENLKSLHDGIYHVVFGPYANDSYTVFYMYGTAQRFIIVDLEDVHADQDKWLKSIVDISSAWISHIDRALAEQNEPKDPLEEWTAIDMSRAKQRMMRKRHEADYKDESQAELKKAEKTLRRMRRAIWDLEDIICANRQSSELPKLIEQYKGDFKTTYENICKEIEIAT